MISSVFKVLLSASTLSLVSLSSAAPLLYYTPAETTHGLRKNGFDLFSQTVVSKFGASNVFEIPDFGTQAQFADASVLFVNARGQNPDKLSMAEQQNLKTFIDAGGAVFFVGEHGSWTDWNNSFLNLFNDQFTTWNTINAGLISGTAPIPFAGNEQLALGAPGAIAGGNGQPLYGLNPYTMAAIYGPKHNAIALLDTYPLSGANSSHAGFRDDVASWLYSTGTAYEASKQSTAPTPPAASVPDAASSFVLFSLGTVGLMGLRRRLGHL